MALLLLLWQALRRHAAAVRRLRRRVHLSGAIFAAVWAGPVQFIERSQTCNGRETGPRKG